MPFLPFILGAFNWIRSSRLGQALALAAGVLMALALARRSGRRSAQAKQKLANLENYVDVQQRSDQTKQDAARRVGAMSDDELDERLRKSGALRK